MRNNQPVTQKQFHFDDNLRLISGTDLRGHITYCNDAFVEVSGFDRDELIGKPHNIVRHPDMPSEIFKAMWACISSGKVWMGLVKNRRKNGDHYWVSAFVTPVFEHNQVVGYESVRVVALPSEITRAEAAYSRIKAQKPPRPLSAKIKHHTLKLLPAWLPMLVLCGILFELWGGLAGSIGLLTMVISCGWLGYKQQQDWFEVVQLNPNSFSDLTVAETYFADFGAKAQAKLALGCEVARCRTAMTRIEDAAKSLDGIVEHTQVEAESTAKAVALQSVSTQQIASAITQMSTAIQEVSINVERNADSAKDALENVNEGAKLADQAKHSIDELNLSVADIATTVRELSESTVEIGQAASLISSIADQTNLLALNAAIEAARAGEQGRGFSVVADEVRSLALKTRESTDKIHGIVNVLTKRADNAVQVSIKGEQAATKGVEIVDKTRNALSSINQSVEQITHLTLEMSAAVEQQSAVAEHINQQIIDIADSAEITKESSQKSLHNSSELGQAVLMVRSIIRRFAVGTLGKK
ncbi:methyl-accepting chemotaxis protein [Shewanella basaltis]|uniref:methyl-accepting chemotaxis protein n=1 Tax=Shewanella basaltis TaxID=472183 RepID=UPI00200FD1E8|nr:PAS domain-containing methyl-accepting chemotaxis protein [Shewanella basaltis]MCL1112604.1 methyl-accepting chemotaxis protein [Shewanella basaltis]